MEAEKFTKEIFYLHEKKCRRELLGKTPFSGIADAIIQDVQSANENKEIITFFGFSSASFEDPEAVDRYIEQVLEKDCSTPEECVILLGSTDGIFRVAQIAKKKGIPVNVITTDQGIHHFKGLSEEERSSVKRFYTVPVEEYGWMHSPEGEKVISPVTDALVRASDKIHMVGGGYIAITEMQYALQQQKPVIYFPAKFNQKKLKELAKNLESTNPIQIPTSPYGFLFEYLMEVDPDQVTGLTLSYPEQWRENPAYLALWEHLEGNIDQAERTINRLLQRWNSSDLQLPNTQKAKLAGKAIVDARKKAREESGYVIRDQYFTLRTEPVEDALANTSLEGKIILEFGGGTGNITTIIEKAKPKRLISWEIDPPAIKVLKNLTTSQTTEIREANFLNLNWQELVGNEDPNNVIIICNPPYFALDRIKAMIEEKHVQDVILYIPQTKKDMFPESEGWEIIGKLYSTDFYPIATSNNANSTSAAKEPEHLVIARGIFITDMQQRLRLSAS